MLELNNLSHSFDDRVLFDVKKLTLKTGEHLLLTGPSGSGKTTLFKIICGLIAPNEGTVSLFGKNLKTLKTAQVDRLRGANIGIIFQKLHLIPTLTVMENSLLSMNLGNAKQDRLKVLRKLEDLGIREKKDSFPKNLSHGEAQRAAIVRAVINDPKIIVADEPTSNLDDSSCEQVIKMLFDQAKKNGASLIVATHDDRVKKLFKNVLNLRKGKK